MAFKNDNYWGNRTPSSNQQIKRPANFTSPDNTSGLSDADLAILQARLSNPAQAAQTGQVMGDQFVKDVSDRTAGLNIGMGLPVVTGVTASKPFVPDVGPRLGDTMAQGASKGVGDIASGISGIAQSLFGGGDAQQANSAVPGGEESPEDLYARLRKEAGQYTYNGPSADAMAHREFDPQFALLDQLAKQTTDQYNGTKPYIENMYKSLVDGATAGRAEDQKNFAGAVDKTGQNYADASKNITDNSSSYTKAMNEQLARLGVQEGLGDINGQVRNNLQDNLGQLNKQGAGTKDMLTGLGANEYAFDTRNIGTTKQAGVQTQEQFLGDYLNKMQDNGNQHLQLAGQAGSATNNYEMQIQKLLQQGQGQQSSDVMGLFKSILGDRQNQADNTFKAAGLDLNQSKFDHQITMDQAKLAKDGLDTSKMNPYDALMARALKQFGGDTTKARQAANDILSAYQNDPNPQSVGDFLNGLDPNSSVKTNPEMTSLLYEFLNKALPRK